MELLIPTLNKFITYQFLLILLEGANHEQSSQNNFSTCGTTKYKKLFFKKKAFLQQFRRRVARLLIFMGTSRH